MRVLHVVPSLSATRGGPSYVAVHLARALAARGARVELIATRSDLRDGEEATLRATLGAIPLTLTSIVGTARLELSPLLLPRLVAQIRHADLVHVHTVFTYPAALAPIVCRALSVPYLVRPAGTLDETCLASRSTGRKRLAIGAYVRPNLLSAAAVHVTSALERNDLAALAPEAHLELMELGVALPDAAPPVRTRRVGYLGRLHPIKRIEVLIRALSALPDVELVLAGAGDAAYETSLRDLASALGVGDRTRFLGHVDDHDKRAFLASCAVVASPSSHESFGVAVAEALAAARPVVVSPEVGLASEVTAHGAGLVAAADPPAFAAALASLLDEPLRAQAMGRAGRALAESRWSWDAVATRTLEVYAKILARRGG